MRAAVTSVRAAISSVRAAVTPIAIAAGLALTAGAAFGQRGAAFLQSRDHAAIRYSSGPVHDPVAELNERIESGAVQLTFEPTSGYLRSVLTALNVPIESQLAVFSQTSFQAPRINPKNPRALFFNDQVEIGWVRGGEVLEAASEDPQQGVIFYIMRQDPSGTPQFKRNDGCLACHLSLDTLGVPGLMVLSSFPPPRDKNAYAIAQVIDHRSRLEERWGGWYVTGTTGVGHMGNGAADTDEQDWAAIRHPPELQSLEGQFDPTGYPALQSDVVALMVLEHQTHMTNLLTRLNWEARIAASGTDAGAPSRVREAAEELVDYLLFIDEEPLHHPIRGASGFTEKFSSSGPRDAKNRSLRQLDLNEHLMRYPCSYMIYGAAFDALPPAARDEVYRRMWRVLSGQEQGARYARLSAADRRAVIEILSATKKDLPPYFRPPD